jgi:hypothetical protein
MMRKARRSLLMRRQVNRSMPHPNSLFNTLAVEHNILDVYTTTWGGKSSAAYNEANG